MSEENKEEIITLKGQNAIDLWLQDAKVWNKWELRREGELQKAVDKNDAERLRRLKDLALSNNDHALALKLYADEMRAKRWHEGQYFSSLLDLVFDKICDYGQSISRPIIGVFVNVAFFAAIYMNLGKSTKEFYTIWDHLQFSLASSFPLISISGKIKDLGSARFYDFCCALYRRGAFYHQRMGLPWYKNQHPA
jgi:hypothetical protein